ncbi:hypothetical protein BMA721280_D0098 [Burkholderia mallei 2002721280]|nr:hypothetical protein BMA10247_2551 [Burkholderia mallei NCTC 10247]EDK53965.1 hypothetical protein BMAFMH_0614 [Burkholderia mallei FMH]EDK83033.1 hypothetical protein BMA721280_D0098 [Burkholderia mallei 2002721280]EDO94875.1 hypothetical protein BURPSPAST_AB0033 [Burkholderia pseudomallei Pasteur 52237]EDP84876.1 hypothetical protein BMA10399_J0206 [Burkholderia mallei ATCC 10399]EEP86901.1 conserved hypothetical protein [Burkholderia mallei GB8 horse 4]
MQSAAATITRIGSPTKTARAHGLARRYHRGIPTPVPVLEAPR